LNTTNALVDTTTFAPPASAGIAVNDAIAAIKPPLISQNALSLMWLALS
jgi:hypothetical protein